MRLAAFWFLWGNNVFQLVIILSIITFLWAKLVCILIISFLILIIIIWNWLILRVIVSLFFTWRTIFLLIAFKEIGILNILVNLFLLWGYQEVILLVFNLGNIQAIQLKIFLVFSIIFLVYLAQFIVSLIINIVFIIFLDVYKTNVCVLLIFLNGT